MSEEPTLPDRDLTLNSLSRYAKDSPRFVLEEYSNCEVPAGCGGAVLRWRDPNTGVLLPMRLYSPGEVELRLDGEALPSGRPIVAFGEHVLAFTLSGVAPRHLALIFAAVYDENVEHPSPRLSHPTGVHVSVTSAADGTWRYSLERPSDDAWMRVGFDDSGWSALVENESREEPKDATYDPVRWQVEDLRRRGATGLGVLPPEPSESSGRLWPRRRPAPPSPLTVFVRKPFRISRPGEREEE